MNDLFLMLGVAAFFALTWGLARLCERVTS
jgi:hypothetical protein